MITALGRSDLTPDTWELVRNDLRERLKGMPADATGLVRAGAGLPLEFGDRRSPPRRRSAPAAASAVTWSFRSAPPWCGHEHLRLRLPRLGRLRVLGAGCASA
ncbi:hypothetical protein SCYAM73S_04299 [Streptomyces cyaneofuscatus]